MNIHPPEWYREHPIFCTKEEMQKPPEELIESIRRDLADLRGKLSDIGLAWPGYDEDTANSEGALTLILQSLYYLAEDIKKRKARHAEEERNER